MSSVLAIAALAILVGLGLLSFKRQRETVALEKHQAGVRSHVGDAQHDRSANRRAAGRAASAETRDAPAQAVPPSTEPPGGTSPQ
jgi:hypothetical protein